MFIQTMTHISPQDDLILAFSIYVTVWKIKGNEIVWAVMVRGARERGTRTIAIFTRAFVVERTVLAVAVDCTGRGVDNCK